MTAVKKYNPFVGATLLLYAAILLLYPFCKYYIDPDGVAYLTLSQLYAAGDYARAVNGYWSPWSCWLTGGVTFLGIAVIPAALIVNTLAASAYLYVTQWLLLHFGAGRRLQWLLGGALALFLSFAVFWQSFDDLWECFFLLAALRLMLARDFIGRPALWLACGALGTLAYFAKAYSFPFFILNTLCCVWLLAGGNKMKWLKVCAVAIGAMAIGALPWVLVLHHKYGIWTTSTAGSLNTSWYLVGHPQWKDGIGALLPPPYLGSPYYWEDPWYVNGATPHFWDSGALLLRQVLRVGLNAFKFLVSILQLSVFFPAIVLGALLSIRGRANALFSGAERILPLSLLLFPAGYLLVNFESRYLWYMLPLGLVLAGRWLQQRGDSRQLLVYLLPLSLVVYPTYIMAAKIINEGMPEQAAAQQMKAHKIQGTFASDARPGRENQRMARLAYLSGSSYYAAPGVAISQQELLREIKRYNIKYFISCVPAADTVRDEQGHALPCILYLPGMRIYQLR